MITTAAKSEPTHEHPSTRKVSSCRMEVIGTAAGMSSFLSLLAVCCFANFLVTANCSPSEWTTSNRNQSGQSRSLRLRRFLGFNHQVEDQTSNLLQIGEVNLDGYPHCATVFDDRRLECQKVYERSIDKAILSRKVRFGAKHPPGKVFTYSKDSEWMKEVRCCGMWKARDCLVHYLADRQSELHLTKSQGPVCPVDLIDRFRRLPTERAIRADVLDYCSEYADGSLICRYAATAAATSPDTPLPLLTLLLLVLITWSALYLVPYPLQ